MPPTKRKPSSDLDALMAAANTSSTNVAEPSPTASNSDLDALMAVASKKKVGTTEVSNGSTTSAPSESLLNQTETIPPIQNSYNIATLNGAIQPEGTFTPKDNRSIQDLLGKINNSPVKGDIASLPGLMAPANSVKTDEAVANREEAITNTALENIKRSRGVYDKTLPAPTKDEVDAEKQKVTKAYNNNDIAPARENGKVVMKRTTGFAETALKGINDAYRTNQENDYFTSLSQDEKIKYLNLKQQFPKSFETTDNTTTPSDKLFGLDLSPVGLEAIGSAANATAGFVGDNAAMLAKGAVGATAATLAAPAVAVAAPIVGVAGAGNFGSFLALADQFGKGGYTDAYQKTYYALKQQGKTDQEAADGAEKSGLAGEATQIGVGAFLSSNIGNALEASQPATDGLVNGLSKSIEHLVKNEAPKMAVSSGAASLVESGVQKAVGVDVKTEDALKEAVSQAGSGAVTALTFWGLHQAAKAATSIPSFIRPLLENVAASTPVEAREAYLDKAVEQGVMTPEEKIKVSKTINQFGETKPAINDLPIPEEKKAAITGKLVQAKKLQEEKDNLSQYGSSFQDRVTQLDAQINNIHEDVNKMYGADDVFNFERDNLTGETPSTAPAVIMPGEINRPTTETSIAPDPNIVPDTKPNNVAIVLPENNKEPNIISSNGENQTGTAADTSSEAKDASQQSQALAGNEGATSQETSTQIPTDNKTPVDESQNTESVSQGGANKIQQAKSDTSYGSESISSNREKQSSTKRILQPNIQGEEINANETQKTEVSQQQRNEGTPVNNEPQSPTESADTKGTTTEDAQPSEQEKPLTQSAVDLLSNLDKNSKPAFVTKGLEKIASENGIEVTGKTKLDDIINALKHKQNSITFKTKQDALEIKKPNESVLRNQRVRRQDGLQQVVEGNELNKKFAEESKPKEKISRTKASNNLRKLSENIRKDGLLPHWAKADLPEETKIQGFGGKSLDEAVAKSLELVADAIDAGKKLSDSVNEGFSHLKDYYEKNTKSFDENKVKNEFAVNVKRLLGSEPDNQNGEWTSIRKEKLKEIEGVKKEFEKRTTIGWNETYDNALKKVQEMYPNKSLYDATRSRVNEFVVRLNKKELFNPTSEDLAVFNVFRAETQKRIDDIEGTDSDNVIQRLAALNEFNPLQEDLMNVARVTNPNGETGRAFGMLQSEIKLNPDYGLKVRRMELMSSTGGDKLSPEDLKWTQEKWDREKEIAKQEEQLRTKKMRNEFDARLADLQKQIDSKTEKSTTPDDKTKLTVEKRKSVADFIRKSADKIENFSKAKGAEGAQISGVDIQRAIADGMRYVADKIEEGKLKIPDIIADAVVRYGKGNEDELRNHIKNELLNAGVDKDLLSGIKEKSLENIKDFAKENNATDITNDMVGKNLIRDYVNSHIGEVDQKDILNVAAKDLKEVLPDVNKKRLIEAYLKEGEFEQPTKKQVEGGLVEAKKQLTSIAKLEQDIEDLNGLKEVRQRSFPTEREKSEYEKQLFDDKNAKLKEITDRKKSIENEYKELETERNRQLKRVAELTDKKNKLEKGIREKKAIFPKVDTPEIENLKEQVKKADENLRKAQSEKNKIDKQAQDKKDKLAELDANIKRAIADRDLIKTNRSKSDKKIDTDIEAKQRELKKAINDNSSEDRVQQKKLADTKKKIAADIKEYKRKIAEGDYEEKPPVKLKIEDAELIKLGKEKETIQGEYRKKQDEYRKKNKSKLERAADFGRSSYVAALIGAPLTFAKVGTLAVLRPVSEAGTKLTFGKVFHSVFPDISKAAKAGGESSSVQSVQKGFEAYFAHMGKDKIEARYNDAEKEYSQAIKEYNEYKNTVSSIKSSYGEGKEYDNALKKLKDLKDNVNSKLVKSYSDIIYKFIGGSSVKDALGALVSRSNEIEKQFGKVEKESFKEAIKYDPEMSPLANRTSQSFNGVNYTLGFIGRSHSALKTFSGRFSYAAGFMARLEASVGSERDISNPNTLLEIAHESYIDWERGKYQQANPISTLWNKLINNLEKGETGNTLTVAKATKFVLQATAPITKVPVNVIHEAVMEYTLGSLKSIYMATKDISSIKKEITASGLIPDSLDFKAAMRDEVSLIDKERAATIARCFRKGGVGAGLYALAITLGCVHYGIFPHLGQKRKKDENALAPDELNPGEVMIGNTKLGEVPSALLDHIPALWPMFMGLGMAQSYHDNIQKGKTTTEAVLGAIKTHLQVIEGDIPQTKVISPTKAITSVVQGVGNRMKQMGMIQDPTKFTKEDLQSPAWQLLNDKGLKPPVMEVNNEKIPVAGKPDRNMTSDEFKEFNDIRKASIEKFVNDALRNNKKFSGKRDDGVTFDKVLITDMTSEELKSKLRTWESTASKIAKSKILSKK